MMKRFSHWTPRYVTDRLASIVNEKLHPDWPWLTGDAVRILDMLLTAEDVGLEFGAGRSTAWFGKRVKKLTSIEDRQDWFEKVKERLEREGVANVDLRLASGETYTDVLKGMPDKSLDFVLVDGALRDVCTERSIPKIKDGGILIIDNINWFLPSASRSPNSRQSDFETDIWQNVAERTGAWRKTWTTNGVTDTLIAFKRD